MHLCEEAGLWVGVHMPVYYSGHAIIRKEVNNLKEITTFEEKSQRN